MFLQSQELTSCPLGLTGDSAQITEAIRNTFEGGLNTALYTSLLSSLIGGVTIGLMAVYIHPRIKRFEARIIDEIGVILEEVSCQNPARKTQGEIRAE